MNTLTKLKKKLIICFRFDALPALEAIMRTDCFYVFLY